MLLVESIHNNLKENMIDKALATNLRKQGNTYKNIASIMGCSVAWCKKNLSEVEVDSLEQNVHTDAKLQAICILEEALMKLRGI